MSDETAIIQIPTAIVANADPDPDAQLIQLWLHGLSEHTERAYRHDTQLFSDFVRKPIREVTLHDVQSFADHLKTLKLAPTSTYAMLSRIKSLFAYAMRLGYIQFDVAKALRRKKPKDKLNQRILAEKAVQQLIAGETRPRNKLMLQLFYHAGPRNSELATLKWSDLQERGDQGGQVTFYGKGGKTRTVLIDPALWSLLMASRRPDATDDDPVFVSRHGGKIDEGQIRRIVKAAAARAGLTKKVSPHWLRHCHASHALRRGATLRVIQETLGHENIATTSQYLHAMPDESSSTFLPPIA